MESDRDAIAGDRDRTERQAHAIQGNLSYRKRHALKTPDASGHAYREDAVGRWGEPGEILVKAQWRHAAGRDVDRAQPRSAETYRGRARSVRPEDPGRSLAQAML